MNSFTQCRHFYSFKVTKMGCPISEIPAHFNKGGANRPPAGLPRYFRTLALTGSIFFYYFKQKYIFFNQMRKIRLVVDVLSTCFFKFILMKLGWVCCVLYYWHFSKDYNDFSMNRIVLNIILMLRLRILPNRCKADIINRYGMTK